MTRSAHRARRHRPATMPVLAGQCRTHRPRPPRKLRRALRVLEGRVAGSVVFGVAIVLTVSLSYAGASLLALLV